MRVAAFLEILQDAAVELKNVVETFPDQQRRRFLATDAARAEGDDGLVFQRWIELVRSVGELAERVQP